MALKLCPLTEYLIKNIFVEKSCGKYAPKVPDPFIVLVNNPKQPLHAGNSFEKKIF